MYTNRVFGTAECVLFIEVSLFHYVLIRGVPPYYTRLLMQSNETMATAIT